MLVAFRNGSWTFSYMCLSMLNSSGNDLVWLNDYWIVLIVSCMSSLRAASHIWRNIAGSLNMCGSSGLRFTYSRIWGLFTIKLQMISGSFTRSWTRGIFNISLIMLESCCWTCSKSGSPAPNEPTLLPSRGPPPTLTNSPHVVGTATLGASWLAFGFTTLVALAEAAAVESRIRWTVWSASRPARYKY